MNLITAQCKVGNWNNAPATLHLWLHVLGRLKGASHCVIMSTLFRTVWN